MHDAAGVTSTCSQTFVPEEEPPSQPLTCGLCLDGPVLGTAYAHSHSAWPSWSGFFNVFKAHPL